MNRSTLILGFTLLAIAATMAASITMRNASGASRAAIPRVAEPPQAVRASAPARITRSAMIAKAGTPSIQANRTTSLCVELPEPWLTELPVVQQIEWRARAVVVQRMAREKLDRLSTELELTPAQRDKMFPLIVRSTSGYDPVMLAGANLTAKTPAAAAEEIHQVLDPQQQTLAENQEVDRQLWWQDTIARLEADLIDSTGGVASTIAVTPTAATAAPVDSAPATEERVAPEARESSNLFDLLDP
jgi:hypothetical protein